MKQATKSILANVAATVQAHAWGLSITLVSVVCLGGLGGLAVWIRTTIGA